MCLASLIFIVIFAAGTFGQTGGRQLYDQIKSFQLTGGKAEVSNLVLKRDRMTITFTGTFYFAAPVEGKVTGAVFVGKGAFSSGSAPSDIERASVRRLLKADLVESDFDSAVLRFSDDTMSVIGAGSQPGTATPDVQKRASEIDATVLEEAGANLSSRIAISILNNEKPGFFFANFRGGKLKNFSCVFDAQTRIPTAFFGLNGGEKGLVFRYDNLLETEVLMAFYSLEDYERKYVSYSDANDLVDMAHYDMDIDLRSPKSKLGLKARAKMVALADGVRAIPFSIGESLSTFEDSRLKKQMKVKTVRSGTTDLEFVQEPWEGSLTVFLPAALKKDQEAELEFVLEGDFMRQPELGYLSAADFSYPRSNSTWYPRHGYLDRSTYTMTFLHDKRFKAAAVGARFAEEPWPEDKGVVATRYRVEQPIALATFALGPFLRKSETMTWDGTTKTIPLEFNSTDWIPVKEDFILAELSNSVRYFHKLFGDYPYSTYSASFHPYGFGQGFPSMLMIPPTDRASKYTYAFISHETAHQWWGNIVAWRSYRDQWLSEGFAEYSGVLYTALRQNRAAANNLIDEMRRSIKEPPTTLNGVGKERLNDIGPIILGHRLSGRKSLDAYQTLVYNKGGLVLRMLHFLFTDPATSEGQPFFDMMKDFVEKYRNRAASTDDFRVVANEHFARSALGRKYNLKDLNWFFQQWVYETHLPSFTLEYQIEDQPDGSAIVSGNVIQENVPEKFAMPLPLLMKFGGNKEATGTVVALGPKAPFKIKVPSRPQKIELDPNKWVLSEKTSTK